MLVDTDNRCLEYCAYKKLPAKLLVSNYFGPRSPARHNDGRYIDLKRAFWRNLMALSISAVFLGGQIAYACTMPDQLIVARTMLNIQHPDATHVMGATWTLQQEGRLEMPNPDRVVARGAERAALEEAERVAAVQAVYDLKNALHGLSQGDHAVSIVVVDRMHRERLLPAQPAALGSTPARPTDELLMVTTEPALHAMMRGALSIEQAVSLGVIRTYGNDSQQAAFATEFGQIGSQPLPSSPMPAYMAASGSSAWSDLVKRAALISKTGESEKNTPEQ